MATYTYEQLHAMTVADLRDIAKDIQSEDLKGYSTMHKDHLLPALCKVLGIHIHHTGAAAEKTKLRSTIRKLKTRRDEALKAGKHDQLAMVRRQIHALKHKLRVMADKADDVARHHKPAPSA